MSQTNWENDKWAARWDERYGREEFAYGEVPNLYFKEQLEKIVPGKILLPAEGEGRNAVFAAGLGWSVSAFDISNEGRRKAEALALKNDVSIDYRVGGLEKLDFEDEKFDVIALIFAHFPAVIKSEYHRMLSKYLKTGGLVILEAFSKNHLKYIEMNDKVGGPKDIDLLCSEAEIASDFSGFEVIELEEKEIHLNEGLYHNGTGSVVRFVGRKPV